MNPTRTHPEQHASWLRTMGIERWQHTDAKAPDAVQPTFTMPDTITHARYVLAGVDVLNERNLSLLASIMRAIDVRTDEVVYVCSATDFDVLTLPTMQADWANLKVQHLPSSNTEQLLSEQTQLIVFGESNLNLRATNTTALPSLNHMLEQPELKRHAWMQLKALKQKPS